MNSLQKYNYFNYNNKHDYSASSLTYNIFENIDFRKYGKVSFFRCDFRGSTFHDVFFSNIIFDRADFISCSFSNCTFEHVDFGRSQIKNCHFENCHFINNEYQTNTIQHTVFRVCSFENEKIMANLNECFYSDCKINNCDFNRSSLDNSTFDHCILTETNLATLHADKLKFVACSIESVKLGLPYIFGYLFAHTSLSKAECLYRGNQVEFELFKEYTEKLWDENRFSEYFNSLMILEKYDSLSKTLNSIIYKLKCENKSFIKEELYNLLDEICFYIENELISYNIIIELLTILYNLDLTAFDKDFQMTYFMGINKIMFILQNNDFSSSFYASAENNSSIVVFNCSTDDYQKAVYLTTSFLNQMNINEKMINSFQLVNAKQGSWVLTYIVVSAIALLIPKAFKIYTDIIIEFSFKKNLTHKMNLLIDNTKRISDLKKIAEISKEAKIISNNTEKDISDELSKILESIKIDIQ